MRGEDKDLAAHFTIITHRGKCLCGASIKEAFADVPVQDYIDSIWNDVADAEEEITDNPMERSGSSTTTETPTVRSFYAIKKERTSSR